MVEVFDSPGGEASVGLARGDVILAIEGAPVAERLAALRRLRALSTPQAACRVRLSRDAARDQGQSSHRAGAGD